MNGLEPSPASEVTSGTARPARRWRSLDALRGLAVVLMIEQHLGVWLWEGPGPGKTTMDYPYLLAFNALGGAAAPLFITLAGMGSALMVAGAAARGERRDRTMLLRGLGVLGFGYLLSAMTPSWFTWRSWFVLHLMGAGMMLGPLWARLRPWMLMAAAGGVLLATPLLQEMVQTPSRLLNSRMAGWSGAVGGEVLPWAPLRLALLEGQFPVFPWLAFFLVGVVAGRWLHEDRRGHIAGVGAGCLALGGLFAASFHVLRLSWFVDHWRAFRVPVPFFPASPAFVLLLLGVVLVAVAWTTGRERRREWGARRPLVTLGRSSLTLLLVHVVMFREWTRPLGLWHGMSASETLATLVGFTVLVWGLSSVWERSGYRYGAEWLLRRLG